MGTVIDIRAALEQFGTGWQFGGSVTEGTEAAWEDVKWEDARAKPAWADLCAAHALYLQKSQFAALRAEREAKLRNNYDTAIAQLTRQLRLATTDDQRNAIAAKIAEWDAWAVALCNLPDQPGAPWDGGGEATPWPELPKI